MPYHAMPFAAALRSHFRHLKRMGAEPPPQSAGEEADRRIVDLRRRLQNTDDETDDEQRAQHRTTDGEQHGQTFTDKRAG